MSIAEIIHRIASDQELQTMLAVVAVDLVLGVLAAVKLGTFHLSYLSNFMRNDLLGKVVPWAFLDTAAIVAGGLDIVIPGVDLTVIAQGAGGIILAALVGSILGSLKDLGLSAVPPSLGSGR